MIVIQPNHDRRIEIPGVPGPVRRPVDIDRSTIGFANLRSLRIYRFDRGSVIEGHAEEDEVFILLLAGSVQLAMIADSQVVHSMPVNSLEIPRPATLSAPDGLVAVACAAYLPPRAAYKLVLQTDADVAYARATPTGSRPPKIFFSQVHANAPGAHILMEEINYAELLRIRLVRFDASQNDLAFGPIEASLSMCESLLHVRTIPSAEKVASATESNEARTWLDSWDTVAASHGEHLALNIAKGSKGFYCLVMAA